MMLVTGMIMIALKNSGFGFLEEKWVYCADEFPTNNA